MGCGGSKKNQVVLLQPPAEAKPQSFAKCKTAGCKRAANLNVSLHGGHCCRKCRATAGKQHGVCEDKTPAQKAEEAEWKNKPATVVVASAPVAQGRKLNVLCLHGTTMSGKTMQWLLRNASGIEPACQDLANFYYPTGPCVVHKDHKIWKAAPAAGPPGPDKRHWYTMRTGWDFSSKAFEGARKVLREFADKEVGGPIDVVCGYSQGAAAATQLLNDVFEGREKNKNLKCIKGAIFLGCPSHPQPCHNAGRDVITLHCNGDNDPLTSLAGARKHAALFKHDTFFEFKGTHDIRAPCADPFRQFLLALKCGEKE